MKKKWLMIGLYTTLIASNAWAGTFYLKQGDLLDADKIDIQWRKQWGHCPTKYPVESVDCHYVYQNIGGLVVSHLKDMSDRGWLTTENTFQLNISLNEATKKKGYPFNAASCQNLQNVVKTGTVITINQTGCVLG
ncbi:hypothetical protein [Legionella oakridgensis]|uniref:Uncharacterized protein n=2 Tax=Legionella oakridgensis TaxID=29423 RepID=W0B8R2_9GAMM|nr:hypothetical protein [Legionella oakridgensis]AHE66923.1 hypothetical protein Loa_01370 [Legionella oakridgensis ATCC 33761 = DSM 21215]ETO93379.1 hypothetical protein LOR_60c14000 [Legionella oakridgensis RV-2-2007]KTD39492.1 hypothetical protein Loak_0918 [Legionella oakridgensis]STY20030.1 Uncharacterised protein [Legionella longbeachae]